MSHCCTSLGKIIQVMQVAVSLQKVRSLCLLSAPLIRVSNRTRGRSTLRGHALLRLQHHSLLQRSLRRVQQRPLLPAEIHGHLCKGHGLLQVLLAGHSQGPGKQLGEERNSGPSGFFSVASTQTLAEDTSLSPCTPISRSLPSPGCFPKPLPEMDVLWPVAALLQADVKLEPAGTRETIGRRGVRECSNPCPTPTLTSPPAGHCLGAKASWHSDQQHCSYQASFPAKPV